MNRRDAKQIAETVSNDDLLIMFRRAKQEVKEWNVASKTNKGLSRGVAWNILASDFDSTKTYSHLAKTNMIREFGEFLPDHLKPKKSRNPNSENNDYVHFPPNFSNWE